MNDKVPPSPKNCRVAGLRKGDKVSGAVFLVAASNFKQTRNQKHFIQMSLRDSSGAIKAIRWDANQRIYSSFGVDDFLRVDGRVEEFQSSLQLIVDNLERVDPRGVDTTNFLPVSDRNPLEMEQELTQAIAEVGNPHLKQLLLKVVEDPQIRPALRKCPAGKALHHAYVGGLLEHICSLIEAVRLISQHYRQLDRDVLFAAAILHDIGKVQELSFTRNFRYTDRGQLLGHIATGLAIVGEKAREIPELPDELLVHVEHIIVSHHGIPEHGALKLPMTAEAIAFHYLDNLDAKLATLMAIEQELDQQEEGRGAVPGKWTDFKPHLGRKLYFPGRGEG